MLRLALGVHLFEELLKQLFLPTDQLFWVVVIFLLVDVLQYVDVVFLWDGFLVLGLS